MEKDRKIGQIYEKFTEYFLFRHRKETSLIGVFRNIRISVVNVVSLEQLLLTSFPPSKLLVTYRTRTRSINAYQKIFRWNIQYAIQTMKLATKIVQQMMLLTSPSVKSFGKMCYLRNWRLNVSVKFGNLIESIESVARCVPYSRRGKLPCAILNVPSIISSQCIRCQRKFRFQCTLPRDRFPCGMTCFCLRNS